MASEKSYKLWGGCFEEDSSAVLRRLNDSLPIDCRLFREDIKGSRCWAQELNRSGHLSEDDHNAIQKGLDIVEKELESEMSKNGRLSDGDEDIHSVVERRLIGHAGEAALKLHTARSRNDQSATDLRLWMLAALPNLQLTLKELITVEKELESEMSKNGRLSDGDEDIHSVVERRLIGHAGEAALKLHTARSRNDQSATDLRLWMLAALPKYYTVMVNRAEAEIDVIVPGYTHLQRAQPIRWSHFLLSHVWSFYGDVMRLEDQKSRLSCCPLGSGAIAGCALAIDRERLGKSLGFETITYNSMFGVSSRDHIVEFLNWASLCGLHLSRLAEDLIIYSSQEYGFIRFSDQFSTGSSLMPQKRNPDGLELVRGSAGLLLGDSFAFSCTLKGLPSTYNKDLQTDKELLFRSFDRLLDCLKVTIGTISTMQVLSDRMLCALEWSMCATDVSYALVRRGVPFRRAHALVGAALRRARALNLHLRELPHHEYIAISPDFGDPEELKKIFSWEASVEQYTSTGGTARKAVEHQISTLQQWLQGNTISSA